LLTEDLLCCHSKGLVTLSFIYCLQSNAWMPPPSPSASRTSSSRPLTAPFNLRGRHGRITPSNESSSNEPSSFASLRQRLYDVSHAHTYSRDHRRILRARVSVQAEIQHQYNRLQQLQRERRRLEDRLRQLQTDRTSVGIGSRRATAEDGSLHNDLHALEQEVFHDYNEINQALSNRIRTRMTHIRNQAQRVAQVPLLPEPTPQISPPTPQILPPTALQDQSTWWNLASSSSNPPAFGLPLAEEPEELFGPTHSPSLPPSPLDAGKINNTF